jgi:hypothetical protein
MKAGAMNTGRASAPVKLKEEGDAIPTGRSRARKKIDGTMNEGRSARF